MRILFITSTRVGDAVLSTGLLDHLLGRYPEARVTIACGPAAESLFDAVPRVDRVLVVHKMALSLHWLKLWAHCVGRAWDVIVDLRRSPLPYLLAARERRGVRSGHKALHRVLELATALDITGEPPAPKAWIGPSHRARAAVLIPAGPPVLGVGPTANWRAKTWRAERFAELIARLAGPQGILPEGRVAVFGRDDERPQALRVIESIPESRRIDLVGRLDLVDASACLERCAFYVGNDSGLMHLTAATGIPTLGLFGPSPDSRYAPWGQLAAVVRTPQAFSEIFPENFDHLASDTLMDGLTVDAVEAAARTLWARAERRPQ